VGESYRVKFKTLLARGRDNANPSHLPRARQTSPGVGRKMQFLGVLYELIRQEVEKQARVWTVLALHLSLQLVYEMYWMYWMYWITICSAP
jgi:hypothetical protein